MCIFTKMAEYLVIINNFQNQHIINRMMNMRYRGRKTILKKEKKIGECFKKC